MKTGINSWFGYVIEPNEKFKMIKQAGFDNVLLGWSDEFEHQQGKKELLPELARIAGLYVENIHVPFSRANSIWENTPDTEDVISEYISCARDCAHFEIPAMVFHLTYGSMPPEPGQWGLDNIERLVDAAEKYGTNIALENIRRPDYIDYVLENIQSDKLKLCYDSGHENCFTKTDMLEKYAQRLVALHLHDNDSTSDQHMIPGDGSIEWNAVIAKIKNTGFNGSMTLECANHGHEKYKGMSAEEFLTKSYARAQKIASELEKCDAI
jgi:sugar phosphate isomerase/epimerase